MSAIDELIKKNQLARDKAVSGLTTPKLNLGSPSLGPTAKSTPAILPAGYRTPQSLIKQEFMPRKEAVPVRRAFEVNPIQTKAPPIVTQLGGLGNMLVEAVPRAAATVYGETIGRKRPDGTVNIGINARRLGYENDNYTTAVKEIDDRVAKGETRVGATIGVVSNKTFDLAIGAQLGKDAAVAFTRAVSKGGLDAQMEAWQALGKPKTPAELKLNFRTKAQALHPDKGGSAELFAVINNANKVLEEKGIPSLLDRVRSGAGRYSEVLTRETPVTDVLKPKAGEIKTFPKRFAEPNIKPVPVGQEANRISGLLPGYRDMPDQAPAFGLSTKKVERVGGEVILPSGEKQTIAQVEARIAKLEEQKLRDPLGAEDAQGAIERLQGAIQKSIAPQALKEATSALTNAYKSAGRASFEPQNYSKAEEVISNIQAELDLATAGERRPTYENGYQVGYEGTKSTFPSYIPEDLRSRKLFDSVNIDLNQIRYPKGSRQARLYDAVMDEMDRRLGINTSEIRSGLKPYTQADQVAGTIKETPKTIQQIAMETKIKEPNVRRILGVGAKEGTFTRVDKGVYIVNKNGEDLAFIEPGDALEVLPRLAKEGFKSDMVFLDIPYKTPAITGGNRKRAYEFISPQEFGKVLDSVKIIARNPNSPVVHMFSQAPSGMTAMMKYNNMFLEKGFVPVGKGELQKMNKNNTPVGFPARTGYKITEPEGIIVFTQSGQLDKDLQNLNFKLVRPKGYDTEKPAEMLSKMIEMTTNEGDIVLDPFAGSGVTGAEAVKLGRKPYLIEKDKAVAEGITKPRVEAAVNDRVKLTDKKTGMTAERIVKRVDGDTLIVMDDVSGIPYKASPDRFDFSIIKKGDPNAPLPKTGITFGELAKQERKPPIKFSEEGIPLSTAVMEARMKNRPPRPPVSNLPPLPPPGESGMPKPTRIQEPTVPTTMLGLLKRNLAPLNFVSKETQAIFRKWQAGTLRAKELQTIAKQEIKIEGDGMDLINRYQAGENLSQRAEIKKIFDDLQKEAIAKGIDVPYRENYIPQVYQGTYKNTQEAMANYLSEHGVSDQQALDYINGVKSLPEDVATRLKVSPSFEKERVFDSYKVAAEYGLKPKYKTVAELVGYYKGELEKVIANKKLMEELIEGGKLVPDKYAPKDWTVVESPFTGNKTYRAQPNVAKIINDIFKNPDDIGLGAKIVEKGGTSSKFAQEVALSAGVPGTTVNFFAIGQLVKELTTGNLKAVNAFIRANSNSATVKFFQENKQTLLDMAEQGVDVTARVGSFSEESVKDLVESFQFRKAIGTMLEKGFGAKTFRSFMPMMQVQLFKDVVKGGLASGLSASEAKKLAGQVVSKNFGLNTDAFAQSKTTKDTMSAFLFAPKFRETIVRSLFNTGKAGVDFIKQFGGLRGKLDPSLQRNRRLLLGMILTYGAYNAINYKLNGYPMWDNPKNRTFAIRIPRENGEVIYVEFMPSYLATARNLASGGIALGKGDLSTAGQKFGTIFSIPFKVTSEVLTNSDYFGNQIYKDTDDGATKAKKIALYAHLQVNHPYIKEIVNQIEEKKPLYQSLVAALELPLKFSSLDKESTAAFYDALDLKAKENAKEKSDFKPTFDKIQKLVKEGKIEEATALTKAMTPEEYAIYKKMKTAAKTSATFANKTKGYQTYLQVQDLIKAGKIEEATAITKAMTPEEYKAYKALKEQFK